MKDRILLIVGAIAAVITGALLPAMAVIVGQITNTFDPDNSAKSIKDTMNRTAGYICIVGLAM